ncbi:ribonuclease H-like domain-containing protein [Tanacetum coccineum]
MALMAFTDSEVTNDRSCSKCCLKNYEALKKQYDDLLVKLDDTGFKAATYKKGLSILERQVVKYKEHKVLFSEEIALLKRSIGHKEYLMGLLRTELEKVKEEKEGFEFKIAKFEKSAKDLDQLLASQITDKTKKGFGYNAVPSPHPLILNRPTPLDLSYSGLEEFKQPEVNEYGPRDSSLKPTTGCDKESDNSKENTDDSLKQQQKTDSKTSSVKSSLKVDKDWKEKFFCPANHVREEEPKKARENNDAPIIEDWVSDDEDDVEPIPKVEKKTVIPTATKKEFVKPKKPVRRSVRYAEMYRSQRPRGNQRNWNGQKSNQLGCNFVFNNKACFICGSFDHIQYSCPKTSHPSAHKHMAPKAVLMKTGLKSVNTARPVNTVRSVNTGRPFSTARSFNTVRPSYTAYPKSTNHCARPRTYFQNQAQSTVHRPFYKRTTLTKRSYNQRFNTGRQNVNTGRQNVNTGRQRFNTGRARGFNAVKPSACWVWRPIKPNGASLSNSQLNDKGFVDSGCSRHMTGNITHLSDFKDFDGGYVTFGGGAYGGRITSKGTIKTDNLDFDDVYFVKELKFNLFSVSQMCDKKNYVLFTDSECLVLSPNFKLPDENQILLKIPRQDNMYSFDMKNIVPKDSLTCLVAKATSEESMLWHRRLGHINFKNINKLVKENLVEICLTPQQNGVAKWMNRTIFEAARTMLAGLTKLTTHILGRSSFYCLLCTIRVLIVKALTRDPYELFRGVLWSLVSFLQQDQDCIVMPIWKDASYFGDDAPRSIADAQIQDEDREEQNKGFKVVVISMVRSNRGELPLVLNCKWTFYKKWALSMMKSLPMARIEAIRISGLCLYLGFMVSNGMSKVLSCSESIIWTASSTQSLGHILLVQIYVDDIIFISTKKELCDEFEKVMKDKCEVCLYSNEEHMEAELLAKGKRFQVSPKTSHLLAVKRIFRYLKGKPSLGLWYPKDSPLELVAYTDSDYAGATQDRKSTTGGCQFLGNRLISWQCKKQTVVATSTTEAEYVAAANCCGQIDTEHNVADLLTKGFDAGRFQYLVSSIGMLNP